MLRTSKISSTRTAQKHKDWPSFANPQTPRNTRVELQQITPSAYAHAGFTNYSPDKRCWRPFDRTDNSSPTTWVTGYTRRSRIRWMRWEMYANLNFPSLPGWISEAVLAVRWSCPDVAGICTTSIGCDLSRKHLREFEDLHALVRNFFIWKHTKSLKFATYEVEWPWFWLWPIFVRLHWRCDLSSRKHPFRFRV